MDLPLELELKILSYIEPNPVIYTRLAMVCRSWYSLFTSDEKWLALDISGIKTGLFKHYLQTPDLSYLKHCWGDYLTCKKDLFKLYNRNNRVPVILDSLPLLGLLRHHSNDLWVQYELDEPPIIESEHYARVAIGLNYEMLDLVETSILVWNPDIVEHCVSIDPMCLNWLDADVLVMHKKLIMRLLRREEKNFLSKACIEMLINYYDRDFLWEASEYQPSLFKVFDTIVEDDRKIMIKVGFYQKLLNQYSRDELKEIFSRPTRDLLSDIELFRTAISDAPRLVEFASGNLLDDEQIMMQAVKRRPALFLYLSPRLSADANFCAALVNSNFECFHSVPEDMKESEAFRRQLTFGGWNSPNLMVCSLPLIYWDDEVVVRNAIRRNGRCFVRVSDRILGIRELVKEAVQLCGDIYGATAGEFRYDREIALLAMKSTPYSYWVIPEELQDKEIAMEAARAFVNCKRLLLGRHKHDREVVLRLIDSYPRYTRSSDPLCKLLPIEFWGDREVALKLVRKLPACYFNLSDDLRMDREIVLATFGIRDLAEVYGCNNGDEDGDGAASDGAAADNEGSESDEEWQEIYQLDGLICDAKLAWVPEPLRHDLEVVRAAIAAEPSNYNCLPVEIRRIKEVAKLALENSFGKIPERQVDISLLPPELYDNKEVMSCAVKDHSLEAYSLASDRLKGQRKFVLVLLASYFEIPQDILSQVPAQVWADRDFVVKAVRWQPDILELAPLYRDDNDIVKACICGGIQAHSLKHASSRLLGDREFILDAIDSINSTWYMPPILSALPPALRDDEEIVERLVHVNEENREFASDRLVTTEKKQESVSISEDTIDDSKQMLELVSVDEVAVKSASERLRDNKQFALAVLNKNQRRVEQLQYFSPRLRDDFDVVKLAFEKTIPRLELVSESLRDETELAQMAVQSSMQQLQFVSERVREDWCFITVLIEASLLGGTFDPALIPGGVYNNKQKIMRIIRKAPGKVLQVLFEACSPRLRDDLDMALEAMIKLLPDTLGEIPSIKDLKQALGIFASASKRLQSSPELVQQIKKIYDVDPYFLAHYLPDELRDSKEFMMELVRLIPITFRMATHRLRGDCDLLSRAIESDPGNSVYATKSLEDIDDKANDTCGN